MNNAVTAFAPASVSNVACGFDIMGFALDGLGDSITVRFSASPGIRITSVGGRGKSLPLDPDLNTAGPPVTALAALCGCQQGIDIEITKGFAHGSGLGSSAASAVAATVAVNELLDAGLSKDQLLSYALLGEQVASGAIHADNVAPCLFGGFILVRGYDPIDVVKLPPPSGIWCAIIHPEIEISTKASRMLLPAAVPLRDVVRQTGNAAGLVAGILLQDSGLIGRSLHDVIAEPARAHTITGFAEMKQAALDAGALGCSISGSGPALFALTAGESIANDVASAMARVMNEEGLHCDTCVSRINPTGAIITGRN